jgi:hypothetical protein
LRFYYQDQVDLTLNVALTPFKERFQDTLAGMTATLEFEVPNAINDCITPYRDLIHTGKLILGDRNYRNVGGQLAPELFNIWPVPEAPAVYTFEAEVRFSLNYDLTPLLAVGEVPQITFIQDADPTPRVIHVEEFQSSPELVGVPQTVNFKFTIDLEDAPPDDNRVFMFWGAESPGPQLANAVDALEGILKIYKP